MLMKPSELDRQKFLLSPYERKGPVDAISDVKIGCLYLKWRCLRKTQMYKIRYILWSQRVDPKQWIYAIIVLQPFCNLYCAIFAMLCFFLQHFADNIEKQSVFLGFLSTYCKKYKTCVFLQHFVESTEKPLVPLYFFALGVQKHHKTCAFCITLLNMLENVGFPLFLALIL